MGNWWMEGLNIALGITPTGRNFLKTVELIVCLLGRCYTDNRRIPDIDYLAGKIIRYQLRQYANKYIRRRKTIQQSSLLTTHK
jgi:hypothetical protein